MLVQKKSKVSEDSGAVTIDVIAFEELSYDEQRDLINLERQVERAVFVAGKALGEICARRLYRATHQTFEGYCRHRFGFTRDAAYLKMGAAEVFQNLENFLPTNGRQQNDAIPLPTNERQVRPLTQLEPSQQVEVWQQAVAEADGKLPSGRLVKGIVERIREKIPVPNPWKVGDICTLVVKDNPELRGKGGCWAIVTEVHDFSCTVRTGYGDAQARIENLEELILSPAQKKEVVVLGDRLNRLRHITQLDRGVELILAHLSKQWFLTPLEEKFLKLVEDEYLSQE